MTNYTERTKPTTSYIEPSVKLLLQENSFRLLLESGDSILLESSKMTSTPYIERTKPSTSYTERTKP